MDFELLKARRTNVWGKPSAHLQAVAYLIGETAAEKIINEHQGTSGS